MKMNREIENKVDDNESETKPKETCVQNVHEYNTTGNVENEADLSPGRRNLRKWLGKPFRVVITDGRVLVGYFNCTDKDANLVLSMCAEYLEDGKDARILGNVMVPGKHIVSISVDEPSETET